MTDMRAQEFITDKSGAVVGVKASGVNEQPYRFNAGSYILASGYGADPKMVPEQAKHALFYGIPTETGDGFKMAVKIGADRINMDCITIYPNGLEVQPGRSIDMTASSTLAVRNSAIYVNSDGRRVINENESLNALARATMAQKDYTLYLEMTKRPGRSTRRRPWTTIRSPRPTSLPRGRRSATTIVRFCEKARSSTAPRK